MPLPINPDTCNALDVIACCAGLQPNLLAASLRDRIRCDRDYASDKRGRILVAILASARAAEHALFCVEHDRTADLRDHMGPAIIALNIACELLAIDRAKRSAIVSRTWEQTA
jgi:hypothetical protein